MSLRVSLFSVCALAALLLGAIYAFPKDQKNFVPVRVGNAIFLSEVADTQILRVQGLSGREKLDSTNGMLFIFDEADYHGIWMKDMKFPIDILWIRNGVVVDMKENAPIPHSSSDADLPIYRPGGSANYVLEINAGFAASHAIKIGDRVTIGNSTSTQERPLGSEYFIETLQNRPFHGKDFKIGEVIATTDAYQKYSFTYSSERLTISGIMNVPKGEKPGTGFPVLILNHGMIGADTYFSGRGSKREQDFFARHGYVTLHPDYRGLASSSPNEYTHHDFYQGYTEDVVNLIEAIKQTKPPFLDLSRLGMWGHSMGGGIAARIMVLSHDIKAFVLFAPISADAKDNFYELSESELSWLDSTYNREGQADQIYAKISPINYFKDVSAPVQLHHGTADTAVPIEFSAKMYETLQALHKRVEFYKYPGEAHEFINAWPVAAERSLQFFDKYVKNVK